MHISYPLGNLMFPVQRGGFYVLECTEGV